MTLATDNQQKKGPTPTNTGDRASNPQKLPVSSVAGQVPRGYEAYARIFHAVSDAQGDRASWSEVAKTLGSIAHREMQWHALVGSTDHHNFKGSLWPGSQPLRGEMDLLTLDALCVLLAAWTREPDRCFFGLCTITRWEDDFSPEELSSQARLSLPYGRDYVVLTGSLADIDQIAREWSTPDLIWAVFRGRGSDAPAAEHTVTKHRHRGAPNLIWPADRCWFVISEVDFDSTLVGGPSALIDTIVESREVEAWKVKPTDSLAYDADRINTPANS